MIRKFEKTPGQNAGKSVRVGGNTGKEKSWAVFCFCKHRKQKKPRQGRQRRTPPGQKAKAIPHNSRLTAQAPLRRLRHGICVAKMLDNVGLRYPHRTSGAKAPRTLRPLPLLRFAVSATGGAHLCSIQYYLRFWLGICRTSLAVSALRIMRYCQKSWAVFCFCKHRKQKSPGRGSSAAPHRGRKLKFRKSGFRGLLLGQVLFQ